MTRILIVDDEDLIRRMLGRLLKRNGYDCTLADCARAARVELDSAPFDLVLSDVNMPGESGLELVRHVLTNFPDTAAVMVTGVDDPGIADVAIAIGAYGYIIKPFETNEVLINVTNALRRRELEIENRGHRIRLETLVAERTVALKHTIEQLEAISDELRGSREETIQRLALAAEFRSDETAFHIRRMSLYSELLARHAGSSERECELIRIASPMHDIGKIGTPDSILMKRGKLDPAEFDIMRRHAEIGYRILHGSSSEMLMLAADIAWTHHEKWDGTGYPRGLVGEAISFAGRITAICDVFDALTSARCYKPAFTVEHSRQIMDEGRGKHFDPALYDLFWLHIDEVLTIRVAYDDPPSKSPEA
jgi:putative two-component system response regulator